MCDAPHIECHGPPPHLVWKNMKRHMACVPKGFLRYHVLRLLRDKPMSGSEIMEAIERETHGFWKPSPGSIYPLLAWLQDNGYIKEVPSEEGGVRRYTITEQGLKLLEEQAKMREKIRKMALFAPRFMWLTPPPEGALDLQESFDRLVRAFVDFREALEERVSREVLKEVSEILKDTAERIEALTKKLRE
ncbi:MAG: PadR family transcriptional regulator [Candidatus Bathyarchaeia archaeon]